MATTRERNMRSSPPPRPLMPRLPASTSNLRASPTPRLAPSTGRAYHTSTSTTSRPLSINTKPASPYQPEQDADNTPIKDLGFINVTPRSSARKSKVYSANSTPTSASVESVPAFSPLTTQPRMSRLAISNGASSPRSAVAEKTPSDMNRVGAYAPAVAPLSPSLSTVSLPPSKSTQPPRPSEHGPSFFRAEDRVVQTPPQRPALQKSKSSFFYADGRRETGLAADFRTEDTHSSVGGNRQRTPGTLPPIEDQRESLIQSGRFNASPLPLAPGSVASGFNVSQAYSTVGARSPSPTRKDLHLTYRKGASQVIRPPLSHTASHSAVATPDNTQRRVSSLDTTTTSPIDKRNSSGSAVSSVTVGQLINTDNTAPGTRRASLLSTSVPPTPSVQATATSPRQVSATRTSLSYPSATPSTSQDTSQPSSQDQPAKDTTTAARHARKVLDLEISNSSLLAINRSLEREVRKQKAEIRRFRRATQNHTRTSWLSDAIPVQGKHIGSLDDVADADGEPFPFCGRDEDDDDDVSDIATTLSGPTSDGGRSLRSLSPSSLVRAERRDAKRLRLDLSKHRELLADSQRMNVSLKRCLGMTEMLIREAGRAVEYKVSGEEGERLGGRVLAPEELEVEADVDDAAAEALPDAASPADGEEEEEDEGQGDDGYDSLRREVEAFSYFDASLGHGSGRTQEGSSPLVQSPFSPDGWSDADEMVASSASLD